MAGPVDWRVFLMSPWMVAMLVRVSFGIRPLSVW